MEIAVENYYAVGLRIKKHPSIELLGVLI